MAAALPATMLHWTILSLAYGVATYVNTFVAQYHGAGRHERVGAAVWQGMYFSLAAGLLLALLAPFSKTIFAAIGHDLAVQQLEVSYFWILCVGTAPVLIAAAMSCYFSGRGKTMTIMWANIGAALTNIVLDYMMIFGVWPFGAWGIAGAAIATVIAQAGMVVFYAWMIYRDPDAPKCGMATSWRFDGLLFRRIMKFGLPNGLQICTDVVCFSLFVLLVGTLGKNELAATNLAFNLNALSFVPLMGLGTAVMTITGQRIGEGRPRLATRTVWTALAWALSYEGLFCVMYWFAPDLMLMPYSLRTDPEEFAELHGLAVTLLRFAAVYACFDGMVIVFSAAVRGAGDTRFAVLLSGIGGMLVMVVPTYVVQRMGWGGLYESWALATAFVVVLGIGFGWRFVQGRWQQMQVIETNVIG
jgi:MATE family multidrug resistance protein